MGEKIGIDTSIFIYLLQRHPDYINEVRKIMRKIQSGKYQSVFSSIGLIEILTGPKKQGDYGLASAYREIITSFPNLSIWGINERVVEVASDLRATYGIATPDAIHLATAIDFGAKKFITNDKGLRNVREISVVIL